MIIVQEQFEGFLNADHCSSDDLFLLNEIGPMCERTFMRGDECQTCFAMRYVDEKPYISSSFFVGLDWLKEGSISCYVEPKLNENNSETDYYAMLMEALEEPENDRFLDDLVHIDFSKPSIAITQRQDMLSLFLIAQFLQILKRIVKKGLKKSFYKVTKNLDSKVKGKILIDETVRYDLVFGKNTFNVCRYQEFGLNCDENKILKKALLFVGQVVDIYSKNTDVTAFRRLIAYARPAFEHVASDITVEGIKNYKVNPLYREYDVAIKYAKLILKRYSYNITMAQQKEIATPPFWIDMSKLFELYILKKLKENFKGDKIYYQQTVYAMQRPDYLLKTSKPGFAYIIDAKYKPRYHESSVGYEDIRQVSGYGRINRIHDILGVPKGEEIKCLIIYANQLCDKELKFYPYDESYIKVQDGYTGIYKIGIKLPEKCRM
jgi:5-methylcytosine-specific restriction enzyme subunit McrC